MQFTNREITQENQCVAGFFEPKRIAIDMLVMLGIGLLLGYLGPFGSGDALGHLAYIYWVIVSLVGFWVYAPITHFGELLTQKLIGKYVLRIALATLVASMLMAAIVAVLTLAFFHYNKPWLALVISTLPKTLVIGSAITAVTLLRSRLHNQRLQLQASQTLLAEHALAKEVTDPITTAAPLLEQLPADKRGELLAIETQDHYLKLYTDKGHHLILMRLKDALTLLKDYPGLQVHRSWWVADTAIQSLQKSERKTWLLLRNGVQVPISRTFAAEVKKRGWV